MKLGIDFKAVATKAAGHAAGAALTTQVNKLGFVQKMSKPVYKGLFTAALGYIGVPILAKKLKLTGKKGGLVEAAGEGMGLVGVMMSVNAVKPGILPTISGIEGYEHNPLEGVGELIEDDVAGYENNPTMAGNDAMKGDPDSV